MNRFSCKLVPKWWFFGIADHDLKSEMRIQNAGIKSQDLHFSIGIGIRRFFESLTTNLSSDNNNNNFLSKEIREVQSLSQLWSQQECRILPNLLLITCDVE